MRFELTGVLRSLIEATGRRTTKPACAEDTRVPRISERVFDDFELAHSPSESTPLVRTTLGVPWCSPRFVESLRRVERFARARQPILIRGESGVGKTSFAEVAHHLGRGSGEPFVVLNCASLPEALLEAELFGHRKGAFTGADRDRAGLIRAARHGTIFLDEIDKASPSFQATLLHVLDRREVRPIGAHSTHEVHARFVLATNRDLAALARSERFLPDLVFRISGMTVLVPPVRERLEDFDLLLSIALRYLRISEGMPGLQISHGAGDLLRTYDWPGNVRELFNAIQASAHLVEEGTVIGTREIELAAAASGLGRHAARAKNGTDLTERVREFERREIVLALRLEKGNQTRAAARLGLSRRGLNKKLHRHSLLEQLERERLPGFRRRGP